MMDNCFLENTWNDWLKDGYVTKPDLFDDVPIQESQEDVSLKERILNALTILISPVTWFFGY